MYSLCVYIFKLYYVSLVHCSIKNNNFFLRLARIINMYIIMKRLCMAPIITSINDINNHIMHVSS